MPSEQYSQSTAYLCYSQFSLYNSRQIAVALMMISNLKSNDLDAIALRADSILKTMNAADLRLLDEELGSYIAAINGDPPFQVYYRWALTAERLTNHRIAFERWLNAHTYWPENEWFLNRCYETGVLANEWTSLLPLTRALSSHLVRRGGRFPESWENAISRLCFIALTSSSEIININTNLMLELISVQMTIESLRRPRDLAFNCLAADLLDLEKKDLMGKQRAADRVTSLIKANDLINMPTPTILLYLMTCGERSRPEIRSILQDNIDRLNLVHLEMIFGVPANQQDFVDLEDILSSSIPGTIALEMLRVSQVDSSKPDILSERIQSALRQKKDTSRLGHEVRYCEFWLSRLSSRALIAPSVIVNPTRQLAVCIYGQMRGFRRVRDNWARFFDGVECDIYISTWRKSGRRELIAGHGFSDRVLPTRLARAFDTMSDKYSAHAVRHHYPSLLKLLNHSDIITEDDLRETYPNLVYARIDDDDDPEYAILSTQEKMYLRGWSSLSLAQASGQRYALVLRIRPDIIIEEGSLRSLLATEALFYSDNSVLWSDGMQRLDYRHGFIMGDRVSLGTPESMRSFLSVWNNRHLAHPGMAGMENKIIAHRTLAFHMLAEGIRIKKLPVRFGLMLDPPPPPIEELRNVIMEDACHRMDEMDTIFLSALDGHEKQ